MRNPWIRLSTLVCAVALHGGVLTPVHGAQEPVRNPVLAQLTILLGEVGVSVDPGGLTIDSPDSSQELHLRWMAVAPPSPSPPANPSADPIQGLTLVTRRVAAGPAPQLRGLRLAPDRLFVAAVDAGNALRSWTIIADPRTIRAESFGPDGAIQGRDLYRPDADLFVTIPNDAAVTALRVYQTLWDGQAFHLTPLGSAPVR